MTEENTETCSYNIDDIENDPPIEVPYMTICFSYCDNNSWSNFNITYSCENSPTQQSYSNKVKLLIERANILLERIIHFNPDRNFICSGYEMKDIVDQHDNAGWLCDKLNYVGFVEKLEC